MFRSCVCVALYLLVGSSVFALPPANYRPESDWLVDGSGFEARVERDEALQQVVLSNGLVRRVFRVGSGFSTVAYDNLATGESLIRAIRPDARVVVDGREHVIGGMTGQSNHAFFTEGDLDAMGFDPAAMRLVGVEEGKPVARFAWKRVRHHAPDAEWPPPGVSLRFDFAPSAVADTGLDSAAGRESRWDERFEKLDPAWTVRVSLHYELYDGIPLMVKWLTVENRGKKAVTVDRFTAETLALVEHSNHVETRDGVPLPQPRGLHVETDMAFGGFKHGQANRHAVHYRPDPQFATQVNYARKQPCLLVVEPTRGPAQTLAPGASFESFRVFELAMDSTGRERRGLALRRMYRTVAPWVTENPLMHHMLNARPDQVRRAIDQAAEVGFEMVILSFGSGFNAENDAPAHLAQWKEVAEYAKSKKIDLGCYSLYSSRRIGGGNDIVCPEGERPTHGNCPAITSEWGQAYLKKLYTLFEQTGFTVFENDGPYPGDVDVTARPPFQKGIADSRWVHWRQWTAFYQWLRGRGVYINAPDYYYLSGSNKCGMGYRETNWSLPRAQQLIHTRQNIHDGTWTKTPSMGWMFVPLSQYHGGGAAATIEPLDTHIDHYERMMLGNLALGVQACYRGPRLYDTPRVRNMVKGRVDWFKQHRDILESDVLHLKRADGRTLDGMLHVNPQLDEKAMLVLFNPTERPLKEHWVVPLHYAGLSGKANVSINGRPAREVALDGLRRTRLELEVPAGGFLWASFSE